MNQNISVKDQLDRAKRALEKAVDAVRDFMLHPAPGLAPKVWEGKESPTRYRDAFAYCAEFRYFYAKANNSAAFGRHVQNIRKQVETLSSLPRDFDLMVELAYAAYSDVENLKKLRDVEVAAKRVSVANKIAQRAELQLQDGIKLGAVDVGQFKVILAGLEPVRLHVFTTVKLGLESELDNLRGELIAANYALEVALPEPKRCQSNEPERREYFAKLKRYHWFFEESGYKTPSRWQTRDDVYQRIEEEATRTALGYVQGYALKLAQKVGEVIANGLAGFVPISATVSSPNLWHHSVAEITLECSTGGRSVLRFHTQTIINRSCLGNRFNQWPTRLLN